MKRSEGSQEIMSNKKTLLAARDSLLRVFKKTLRLRMKVKRDEILRFVQQ
jgi:hypothetical protein